MPLIKGKSKGAFSQNVSTEMHAGKPQDQALAIAYAMKKKAKKMAHGGMIEEEEKETGLLPSEETDHDEEDYNDNEFADGGLVDRIMAKRAHYAEGGVVADEGEAEESHLADHDENDFDYLSEGDLDDASTNSGAADGDEHGDHVEDQDRHDIVERIMRQRSMKKNHNPRPA